MSIASLIKQASTAALLRKARNATHEHPTEKQRSAGNYSKGTFEFKGLTIKIENPKDSIRRGTDNKGRKWESRLPADYGYFKGTEAIDGDAVDVFIGNDLESDMVVAVDQIIDGKYDETKFIVAVTSQEQAEKLYLSAYQKGWELGPVSTTTVQQLKEWLKDGDHKKPFKGQMVKAALQLVSDEGSKVVQQKAPDGSPMTQRGMADRLAAYAGSLGEPAPMVEKPQPVLVRGVRPAPEGPLKPQPGVYGKTDGPVVVRPTQAPGQTREEALHSDFGKWYKGYSKREGGVTNDSGGYTVNGISENSGLTKKQIMAMTPDDRRAFYATRYDKLSGIADPAVRASMMEAGMNAGETLPVRSAQRAAGIKVDGRLGPQSVAAINAAPPSQTNAAIVDAWKARHQHLAKVNPGKYGQYATGWKNRRRDFVASLPPASAQW